MSEFKVGDSVRHINARDYLGVGVVERINKSGGAVVKFENDANLWPYGSARESNYDNYLELIGGTMNVGDILDCKNNNERKVLAYLNQGVELVLLSEPSNHDETEEWYTVKEVEGRGWKLKTEPQTTEMTVAEIEEALGKKPGSLRVKK